MLRVPDINSSYKSNMEMEMECFHICQHPCDALWAVQLTSYENVSSCSCGWFR